MAAPTSGPETYDLLVIGAGINGCGIARDAVGRGLSVTLAEMNDLASATSGGSTKLFHGGLRYLEYFEFRLVREALLHAMPHIAWPMRFEFRESASNTTSKYPNGTAKKPPRFLIVPETN